MAYKNTFEAGMFDQEFTLEALTGMGKPLKPSRRFPDAFLGSLGIELGVGCCFFRNYEPFLLGFSVFASKNVQNGG